MTITFAFVIECSMRVGALYVLYVFIKQLKILEALGKSREALLVVWLICARILFQGSRLKAARMARHYAIKNIIGVDGFNENHLYKTLKWLSGKQKAIEDYLIKQNENNKDNVFLYDVTSCYFEGEHNVLSDYGYNRDGKKGKKQIV
ncbi:MAG: hypothetical protein HQL03_12640 [Nitrospirae bacterium]|nr:hypothetical protein [Nitrospirota bacterium]MBF0592773.1 hypothetical protein [Nitrospirota bacterium]